MEMPEGWENFKRFIQDYENGEFEFLDPSKDFVKIIDTADKLDKALFLMKEMAEAFEKMNTLIMNGPEGAKTDPYYLLKYYISPVLSKFKDWK